jgi:sugar phosphate isomerase/epimerase
MNWLEHRPPAIGLQLWTIRDALEADADRALAAVKAAGFSALELAPLPPSLTPSRLVECLRRHALTVLSVHCDLPTPDNVSALAGLARRCECSKLIWHGWPRDVKFDTLAGVQELSVACNAAAALAREHGLSFGMHNHWWEFEHVERVQPIRMLHEMLGAEVFWQLDVYWAQTAGVDPADVLSEFSPRIKSIHWKDGPCAHGEPMTALGRGNLDVRCIVEAVTESMDWIVELDECATDPLEAARQSRLYLELISV